jgi:hypothetical protein
MTQNIKKTEPTFFQFEETGFERGVRKNVGSTQLLIDIGGVYEVWHSVQLHSQIDQDVYTNFWIRLNGIDVPRTNSRVETTSRMMDSVPIVPHVLSLRQFHG